MFTDNPVERILMFIGLIIVLSALVIMPIRRERKQRMVYPWQDEVVPEWSNISASNFDALKHFLVAKTENDREDVVHCVVRKHGASALGLIPAAIGVIIGLGLIVVLSTYDMSSVTTIPGWLLGALVTAASIGLGVYVWVQWRFVYYMLTNKAVHIIKQPPLLLSFLPGSKKRLPLNKAAMAGTDDSFLGNQLGFVTTQISTYMTAKEDEAYNNMHYMPSDAEFDRLVNELLETLPHSDMH